MNSGNLLSGGYGIEKQMEGKFKYNFTDVNPYNRRGMTQISHVPVSYAPQSTEDIDHKMMAYLKGESAIPPFDLNKNPIDQKYIKMYEDWKEEEYRMSLPT